MAPEGVGPVNGKIERYLADASIETPCLVVDLDRVAENYRTIRRDLPEATIHYAIKANPAPEILKTLVGLGSNFDTSGTVEIDQCLAAGASPEHLSCGSTLKKERTIAEAHARGIRLFAFDSEAELEKLVARAPGSRVYCRILVSSDGADWPLSRKFGCDLDMAAALLVRAGEKGLQPSGVSFHVGSQQTNPASWDAAIGQAAQVFAELRSVGINLDTLNLGGGFPACYLEPIPAFRTFAETIDGSVARHFGNDRPGIVVEPGRFMGAEAGVLASEVVLVSRKSYGEDVRWVYLDIGKFGGLAETMDEAIKYPIRTPHDGGPEGPVVIAGPTCDGADILYENAGYRLPLDLVAGDTVYLLTAGAYTTTYASIGFDGFPPLTEHYI
jgi:ornithine decarboxylase